MPRNVVQDFSIEHVQILDKDGNVDEDLEPDLDEEALVDLLFHMKRGRLLDERALKLSYGGRLGIFAPAKGQEAAQVGTAYAMAEQDWIFPSYRDHIAGIVRGMDLEYSLLYWGGDERGIDYGHAHNVFPIAIPVGSQPLHAVGHAYASQMDGKDSVAVTFFGDGATSTGDTQEAMNFAGAWDVPVLFLCQNNQYAISVPREKKQTGSETIAQKAVSYGFEGVQVDGNDALAVHQEVQKALEKARSGGGPTLIEAVTFRRGPHTTPDDPDRAAFRGDGVMHCTTSSPRAISKRWRNRLKRKWTKPSSATRTSRKKIPSSSSIRSTRKNRGISRNSNSNSWRRLKTREANRPSGGTAPSARFISTDSFLRFLIGVTDDG